ncbi:MAG: 23S rRNA (pseudouridine(1915)-N(3))-methyltransferase RlmH [Bryobacterales bacterium]|nr:23S rRNA (pseudouridine(1915)-N(3))-methyltransferase RlmH [Bryobacteraceae bacterium]MDW8128955.1 23S rRNA (pseudouridine(1915)-N(3))-methyltransferase RlmH [Bryobacterales bacterium]
MKIHLRYLGKPRDRRLNQTAAEYILRAGRWVCCEMRELDPRREDFFARYASWRKILLDAAGQELDTAGFVQLLRDSEFEGRDLVFLLGGAEGLPAGWRERADRLLSLSRLTMAHELARLVLAEQIYRGLATLRGHPYPR